MKKYLKEIKIEIIAIIVGMLLLNIVMNMMGVKFSLWYDYVHQHARFIQYLILNFKETHDMFPQITMNFGLGQSFVVLYYYGMYNPYIFLFQILNFIPIELVITLINILIISMTFIFSYIFLKKNKINKSYAKLGAFLTITSTVILSNIFVEVMFIYYVPFIFLHLIGVHRLIEQKKAVLFIVSFALVFFTNFFFAPIVSIISFVYYITLLYERKELTAKQIINYFKYYFVGCLIGMLILLPSLEFYLQGGRTYKTVATYTFLSSIRSSVDVILSISIVGIISVVGAFFLKKKYKIMAILVLILVSFNYLNVALNSFQYYDDKIYIYLLPIIILLFIKTLEIEKKTNGISQVNIILITSILLATISYITSDLKALLIMLLVCLSVYLYKNLKIKYNILFLYIIVLLSFYSNISYFKNLVTIQNYNEAFLNLDEQSPKDFSYYRELNEINDISSIYSSSVAQYTSFINTNYIYFINELLSVEDLQSDAVGIMIFKETFDNMYLQNYLGIQEMYEQANPILYGVSNLDVYNLDEFLSLEPYERTMLINQGIFVEGEVKEIEDNFIEKTNIKKIYSNDNIVLPQDELTEGISISKDIEIPKEYQQPGEFIINVDTSIKEDSQFAYTISVSNHIETENSGLYPPYDNNYDYTFLVDSESSDEMIISGYFTGEGIAIDSVEIYFQSEEDFENSKVQTVKPENFTVDLNHSYEFDLNMEKSGYLASTIPYDKGFDIYVDGQKKEVEKINNSFIGAKLDKGSHHIKVEYHIPGFKGGIFLTIAGIGGIIYIFIRERKI